MPHCTCGLWASVQRVEPEGVGRILRRAGKALCLPPEAQQGCLDLPEGLAEWAERAADSF